MPVITVDEKGFYQSYCILTGEMPAVIWNGGIGLLLPPDVVPQPSDCIAALLRKANPDIGPDATLESRRIASRCRYSYSCHPMVSRLLNSAHTMAVATATFRLSDVFRSGG